MGAYDAPPNPLVGWGGGWGGDTPPQFSPHPHPLGAWILAPSALSFRGLQLYNPGYAPDLTRTLLDSQLYCPKIRL